MLTTEHPYNGREDRIRYYSDAGFEILQNETGAILGEAVDPYPSRYTYTETDHPIDPIDGDLIPVEPGEDEATVEDYQAALTELGVDLNA